MTSQAQFWVAMQSINKGNDSRIRTCHPIKHKSWGRESTAEKQCMCDPIASSFFIRYIAVLVFAVLVEVTDEVGWFHTLASGNGQQVKVRGMEAGIARRTSLMRGGGGSSF